MVTDAQVRRLREHRMTGKALAAAAAAAGMSERTARDWQRGALPSTAKAPRWWRTREDPFADVWQSEVVPQLEADTKGRLQVLKLFAWLCRRHPGRFQAGQLRTLQRRVHEWRAQHGPDREVYFEQVAVPGREAAFDFTDASDLGVTIRGVAFEHLLFEWVLSYSRWTYVALAVSETFEALVAGLQGALWTLGAVPAVLRHDNLSAATHELRRSGGRQLTVRFRQVLDHYGLGSSRIQPASRTRSRLFHNTSLPDCRAVSADATDSVAPRNGCTSITAALVSAPHAADGRRIEMGIISMAMGRLPLNLSHGAAVGTARGGSLYMGRGLPPARIRSQSSLPRLPHSRTVETSMPNWLAIALAVR